LLYRTEAHGFGFFMPAPARRCAFCDTPSRKMPLSAGCNTTLRDGFLFCYHLLAGAFLRFTLAA